MGLASGSTIAHYEILTPLGKGGMGEVYRARDTKLKREVAVKIVPDNFAADPQRLQRFQREAELLASLNHPNIAAIYGIEEDKSTQALILELVEGETLAERLRRGLLPLDETLEIAKQIAQALEAAHERGVIHRDLKPANIMLTRDGKTKVLDFGLATISQATPAAADFSNSPTIFSVSGAGILMGTAAYMSPEQARGKAVDRRSDVWAFGCVLYEMLTGRQLFGGETVSDSIAKVLEREPNWNELQKAPKRLRMLLRRCLEKNASRRLRDLGDVLIELEDIRADDVEPPASKTAGIWLAATVIFAALSILLAVLLFRTAPGSSEAVHLSLAVPGGSAFGAQPATAAPVLSPDGRFIAFITESGESANTTRSLWIRPLNSADARPVEESDGAAAPFWSPDSRWVGFFANRKIYRASVQGGKPETIASIDSGGGRASASWNRDGTILFGLDTARPLSRVSAEGGPVTAATALDKSRGDAGHFRPHFLPDGVHFLFLVQVGPGFGPASGVYVGSLESKEIKPVLPGVATPAYYVPSGHMLFVRDSAIFAQDFDLSRLELRDKPIRIVDSVLFNRGNAAFAAFSLSETGILAYRTGELLQGAPSQLTWFDRKGTRLETVGTIGQNRNPRLSPDGSQVAASVGEPTGSTIWLLGPRATSSRFAAPGLFPIWSRDGNHLLYSGNRNGTSNILKKSVSADAQEVLVQPSPGGHFDDLSPDGRFLVVSSVAGSTNRDVIAVSLDDQQKRIPIAATSANELYGRVHPDGRWVAYTSEESGHTEIYLQTFPVAGSRILVSRDGGSWPVWRRDGKELFYISADRKKLMSVTIAGSQTLQPGTPQALFDINITSNSGISTPSHYDVTPDGQRFLIATAVGEEAEISPIHVILNWPALLNR